MKWSLDDGFQFLAQFPRRRFYCAPGATGQVISWSVAIKSCAKSVSAPEASRPARAWTTTSALEARDRQFGLRAGFALFGPLGQSRLIRDRDDRRFPRHAVRRTWLEITGSRPDVQEISVSGKRRMLTDIQWRYYFQRRWPSGRPSIRAFCRRAPEVRFKSFEIFATGSLSRENFLSERRSTLVHALRRARLVFLAIKLPSNRIGCTKTALSCTFHMRRLLAARFFPLNCFTR
jgi:hypothetical protein